MNLKNTTCLVAVLSLFAIAGTLKGDDFAPGKFGKALDGRDCHAIVSGKQSMDGPPLTVSCWAKLFSKRSYNILLAKDTKASSRHWEIFTVAGSGHFTAYLPGHTPDHVHTKTDIVDGQWHHLAMTHDGQRVKLYIDGKLKADQAVKQKVKSGPSGNLHIGALVEGTLHCDGLIDDVHISAKVRDFPSLPTTATRADDATIALWHFDGDGKDASQNGHNARLARRPEQSKGHLFVGNHPKSLDPNIKITEFAREPDLVTPIGIVVAPQGGLLVLESNTHFPPKDYKRHDSDRIWLVEDKNGDGKADSFRLFADGFHAAMHMTVHPSGAVYVVCRGLVIRLRDQNGDGKADEQKTLMKLETSCTYPHNGLFSCAFDWNDRMYVSMGENLGADYTLVGSDGSTVKGGGEGGNIFLADSDGGKVEKYATGFWNPVQLHFDVFGRLFTVDNDPDSRPPCRLLHIVRGGDYGYRFRNGRPGLHPFTAWNGELPGTLPMVAGTGEAPSGLLTAEYGLVPQTYRGSMLVTSWGDHRIERHQLVRKGASFRSVMDNLIIGPESFRPVGIIASPAGSIFTTDWVDKSYPVHGKGRIWKIDRLNPKKFEDGIMSSHRDIRENAARQLARSPEGIAKLSRIAQTTKDDRLRATALGALISVKKLDAKTTANLLHSGSSDLREFLALQADLSSKELQEIIANDKDMAVRAAALSRFQASDHTANLGKIILDQLAEEDPFLRTAARTALVCNPKLLASIDLKELKNPQQIVEVLLALRASGHALPKELASRMLVNDNEQIRFVVLQWIGEERLKAYRSDLTDLLRQPTLSGKLFNAALTSLALLDGAGFGEAAKGGQVYLEKILRDKNVSESLQLQALRRLAPTSTMVTPQNIEKWLASPNATVAIEAVRTLRDSPLRQKKSILKKLVDSKTTPDEVRAEALAGLGDFAGNDIIDFLVDRAMTLNNATLQTEALRSLRNQSLNAEQKKRLKVLQSNKHLEDSLVAVTKDSKSRDLPKGTDLDAWMALLEGPADAEAGERIFYHARLANCARCHRFNGRGSDIGPDLSLTAKKLDRRRLIESIVHPAKEIAPQYTMWLVETTKGTVITGILLEENEYGEQIYADSSGNRHKINSKEIETRQALPKSVMPDDLPSTMTIQEMRDLLAFLSASESKPLSGTTKIKGKLFDRDNLVAWCIVPFDAKGRGPAERVAMLKRLGIRRVAYDWRAQHLPTFAAEVELYQKNGIELVGVWCPPGDPKSGHVKNILDVLRKQKVKTQLWVSGGYQDVASAVKGLKPLAEAARSIDCDVALYNHGGWFGEPENQIAILQQLQMPNVGIVYNFHHGHAHLIRMPGILRRMGPYLMCVNLNGMNATPNPKILPIGKGTFDRQMLQWLAESGYQGPVGILDHREALDAEMSLSENLRGLEQTKK